MVDGQRSINYPFGRLDIDTLIVCHTHDHIIAVSKAFGIKAMYITWGMSLMGNRFSKIIAFRNWEWTSSTILENIDRMIKEDLPIKLKPGFLDQLYVV